MLEDGKPVSESDALANIVCTLIVSSMCPTCGNHSPWDNHSKYDTMLYLL